MLIPIIVFFNARTQSPPKANALTGQSLDTRADDDAPAAWATLEADGRSGITMGPKTEQTDTEMKEPTIGTADKPNGSSEGKDQTPQYRQIEERQMGCGASSPIENVELERKQLALKEEVEKRKVQATQQPPKEGMFPPSTDGGELNSDEEEDMAPDLTSNPMVEGESVSLDGCTYEFFSGLQVRRSEAPDANTIRERLRDVLRRAPEPRSAASSLGKKRQIWRIGCSMCTSTRTIQSSLLREASTDTSLNGRNY
jgi:hypothetical protein